MKPQNRGTKRKQQQVTKTKSPDSGKKQQLLSYSASRSKPSTPLYLRNLTAAQRKKYDELAGRGVNPNRYADKEALAKIGLLDDVTRLLKGIGWDQLLNLNVAAYEELVYEFLCTFEFTKADRENLVKSAMHFHLMGKEYTLEGMELQSIFGWQHFAPYELPEFDAKAFWKSITKESEVYSGRCSKSSKIVNSSYRYIYKLFAYTVFGRENIGPVSNLELAILYCVDQGRPVGFVNLLSRRLKEVIAQKEGPIYMGFFVTMIAKHLKILDDCSLNLTVHPSKLLDLPSLVAMRFLRRSGERYDIISPEHESSSVAPSEPVAEARDDEPILETGVDQSLRHRVTVLEDNFMALKQDLGAVCTAISKLHEAMTTQQKQLEEIFSYMKFHFPQPTHHTS